MNKENIKNLSYADLVNYLVSINEKPFRSTQIFEWVYQRGAQGFDCMTNLPDTLRFKLNEKFSFESLSVSKLLRSKDGTVKYLFELNDGEKIEAVLIPAKSRATVCVSTQAGCRFGCKFCASGIGGWVRDLSPAEIISQVLEVKGEAKSSQKMLTHVVFMGTGEPLDNYSNLVKAIRIINDHKGINIGARRITVSTCGIIPKIEMLAKERLQLELSVSLHGYNNETRNTLMPVNRKYPFNDLIEACRQYVKKTNRQITFEYVLIKGLTCSETAAMSLKKSLKGLLCKMNLIPYNPTTESDSRAPSAEEMKRFLRRLSEFGVHSTLRSPRGRDIAAACGQLRHNS